MVAYEQMLAIRVLIVIGGDGEARGMEARKCELFREVENVWFCDPTNRKHKLIKKYICRAGLKTEF